MIKNNKTKVSKKLFKKNKIALSLAGIMITSPLALSGCFFDNSNSNLDKNSGSIWYSGNQYNNNEGKNGDFFYDIDDNCIYQKTENGWTFISNLANNENNTKEIEIQATDEYIQWKYTDEETWNNIISINALKGNSSIVTIENGVWVIDGIPTEYSAIAKDGNTPYIHNGYWYINDINQNIKAEGLIGENGKSAYQIAYELDNSIGTETEWIKNLQGKQGREVILNVSSTHIQWKYNDEEEYKNLIAIDMLKGIKGNDGKSAYELALENNPTIGSELEWLESLKGEPGEKGEKGDQGEPGKSILNMNIEYEYNNALQQLVSVFTITYTNSEIEIIKTPVPKKISQINSLCHNIYNIDNIAKVETKEESPQLSLYVTFEDNTYGYIQVTNDIFRNEEYEGIEYKTPDFTQIGTYNYKIQFNNLDFEGILNVVDLNSFLEEHNPDNNFGIDLNDINNKTNNIYAKIHLLTKDNNNWVDLLTPLSSITKYYKHNMYTEEQEEINLSIIGDVYAYLKDEYIKYNRGDDRLYSNVYNSNCSVYDINHLGRTLEFSINDENLIENIKNTINSEVFTIQKYFDNQSYKILASDLIFDFSKLDITIPGSQFIPFTYQLPGEEGLYYGSFEILINADLNETNLVATYTSNMHTYFADEIKLYDNGIAVIDNYLQTKYDVSLIKDNILKIYNSDLYNYLYFTIDKTTNKFDEYILEDITPNRYYGNEEYIYRLIDTTDFILDIYGTEGTCKCRLLNSCYIEEIEKKELHTYGYMDCKWIDENTISLFGRTFNIIQNKFLVETH